MKMTESFAYEVLSLVSEIPKGKVSTYGDIAKMLGYPTNSRLVGKVLSNASYYGHYPCHRVVNSVGSLVRGWDEQYDLLVSEGIVFNENKKVVLKLHRWK
jgi:methylated-DNA-protein-cysteine methyltransferase related protein